MGILFPRLPGIGQSGHPSLFFTGVAAAHAALIAFLAVAVPTEELIQPLEPMAVHLVEILPYLPQPAPVKPPVAPRQKRAVPPPPQTRLTSSMVKDVPAAFAVPPPAPAPIPAAPISAVPISAVPISAKPAPISEVITAARFDADYLDNPKPRYPSASRRLGEQGKVLLRVHVSPAGIAETVEIKLSSGIARLDRAARDAVSRWRFIPARRGELAIAAWVQVPITFQLEG